MSMKDFDQDSLSTFVKNLKDVSKKKIKGKFPPISELVNKVPKTLKINAILDLSSTAKNFYLFIVKNHSNQQKIRYFLTVSLATQSSDLLVSLAREYVTTHKDLKLIQYSIHPIHNRVNLLLLKELKIIEDYKDSIELLKPIRQNFRRKLEKIKTSIEIK